MKNTLRTKKFILKNIALLLGIAIFSTSVTAATGGNLDGTFIVTGYNNEVKTTEGSLRITTLGSESEVKTLTPTTDYAIKLTATDLDGLGNSSQNDTYKQTYPNAGKLELKVALFYSSTNLENSSDLPAEKTAVKNAFDALEGVNENGDQFVYTWMFSESTGADPVLVKKETSDSPQTFYQNSTWKAYTSTDVGKKPTVVSDKDATSFNFVFPFAVSKVAKEGGQWYLAVETKDNDGGVSFDYKTGYAMNWYGEITTPVATDGKSEIDWGVIDVNTEEKRKYETNKQTVEGIKYISNGKYAQNVKSTAAWAATALTSDYVWPYTEPEGWSPSSPAFIESVASSETTYNAVLKTDDVPTGKQEFAIKANLKGTLIESLAGATQVSTVNQVLASPEKTTEAGDTVAYDFYLQLSEDFQNGKYDGVVTLTVSDATPE